MSKLYTVKHLNLGSAKRISDFVSADGLKSKKPYPVFEIDGKENFFKPVSKTKPYCSDLFPVAEVFVCNVADAVGHPNAKYSLATCDGISQNPKYTDNGVLSQSFLQHGESALSIHEYLCDNEQVTEEFRKYVNYCMVNYDYTGIFDSKLLRARPDLAEQLCKKVLWSIYTANQNFQYSNVMLVKNKDNEATHFGKCFDNEFSNFFISTENPNLQAEKLQDIQKSETVKRQLSFLRQRFPKVVRDFEDRMISIRGSDKLRKICDFTNAKDFIKNSEDTTTRKSGPIEDYHNVILAMIKEGNVNKAREYFEAMQQASNKKEDFYDETLAMQVNERYPYRQFNVDEFSQRTFDSFSKHIEVVKHI